jgi:hypothetical protein
MPQNSIASLTPFSPKTPVQTIPKKHVEIASANTYTFTGIVSSMRKFVERTNKKSRLCEISQYAAFRL